MKLDHKLKNKVRPACVNTMHHVQPNKYVNEPTGLITGCGIMVFFINGVENYSLCIQNFCKNERLLVEMIDEFCKIY
jgi:hypothetical protein